ncbi:fusaric acid resistance family protein [Nocardia tenerifensis]|uniref:Fusaric acid resistance family protein n=1 Tax=Nocardia tenerifensis TaxID=228006 RepID=A0A318KA44_9NOCA|nr:FUSC family protein [Nocardia tenerifensis]PXX61572.1 fusaric acid resistance family protein [Nocardia tenerifensis]
MALSVSDPLPPRGRIGALLFALPPAGRRWSPGLRSALAFALPAAVLVAAGHPGQALFVLFGAFAVMYGERRAYRMRAWVVLAAGLALLASCGLGAALGHGLAGGLGASLITVATLTVVAVVAVYAIDALRLGPPGALLFVIACGGAMMAAEAGISTSTLLSCTAFGAGVSVLVSMAGVLRDRRKPERVAVEAAVRAVDAYLSARASGRPAIDLRHQAGGAVAEAWAAVYDAGLPSRAPDSELLATLVEARRRLAGPAYDDTNDLVVDPLISFVRPGVLFRLRRSLSPNSHAAVSALRVGVACLVAGGLSALLGQDRPHWAVFTALMVLQIGPDRVRGKVRGIHRFVGTVVGLGLFAVVHQLAFTGYALIALVAGLMFGMELFVPRNYALAAIFLTPIALLAVGPAPGGAVAPLIRDRFIETVIGVGVAVLVPHVVAPRAHRRTFRWIEFRVGTVARALLASARREPAGAAAVALTQQLQFELVGVARAGSDSATEDPAWTATHWPAHAATAHLGYDLLAAYWELPPGAQLPDPDRWDAAFDALTPLSAHASTR